MTAITIGLWGFFYFYYQENLELLESYGVELEEFYPLNGETGLVFGV